MRYIRTFSLHPSNVSFFWHITNRSAVCVQLCSFVGVGNLKQAVELEIQSIMKSFLNKRALSWTHSKFPRPWREAPCCQKPGRDKMSRLYSPLQLISDRTLVQREFVLYESPAPSREGHETHKEPKFNVQRSVLLEVKDVNDICRIPDGNVTSPQRSHIPKRTCLYSSRTVRYVPSEKI